MHGKSCLLPEQAHHVVLAHIKLLRQHLHIQVFRQVGIHVPHDFQHPAVLGYCWLGMLNIRLPLKTADLHQQPQ